MKISGFLAVVEKFWMRASAFFPTKEFADEVKRLSDEVRNALAKQLNITFHTDDDLPPDEKMGETAVVALKKLCEYLDSKDLEVGYQALAERAD